MINVWEITGIHDDTSSSDTTRWLVIYSVPPEYAPDGVFTSSFPKDYINHQAALYGYDLDDPDQVDDLLDHILYLPCAHEVLRKAGKHDEIVANVLEADPEDLKQVVKAQVRAFKAAHLAEKRGRGMLIAADLTTVKGQDVVQIVKDDMRARIHKEKAATLTQDVKHTRRRQKVATLAREHAQAVRAGQA